MSNESDLRKCPECGKMGGRVMHIDEFPCKCGNVIKVAYAVCDCGFSWRAADDTFIDGCNISIENVEQLLSEVGEFFEEQGIFENENNGGSMEELIHRCLRCGEIAVQSRTNLYECTVCGFSWEVDAYNG